MTHVRRIQELVTALGNSAPHVFFTRDDLVRLLQAQTPDADVRDCQEAICRAVTLGVLGHIGANYLRRRDVTAGDINQIVGSFPAEVPVPKAVLLSSQVQAFRNAVAQSCQPHPWLRLDMDRIPLELRGALMSRATEDLGVQVTHLEVERHIHQLAARTLLQAFLVVPAGRVE